MKNFRKYFAVGLALCGTLVSCSLEEEPLYTMNSQVVLSTKENAELALMGCYAHLTSTDCFGQWWQEGPLRACGLTWAQRTGTQNDMNWLQTLANNDGLVIMWRGAYKVISESNSFIESMKYASFEKEDIETLTAEARTIRGICYYYLVTHFGEVPLKVSASTSDAVSAKRESREKVFEQIISDLTYGYEKGKPVTTVGHVTSWTAKAMLAKTYMRMAQMTELEFDPLNVDKHDCLVKAQALFEDVYKNGPYSLEPNFGDIWKDYYTGNENIFWLATSLEGTGGTFNRSTNRFAPANSTGGIAWATNRVQKFVYDWHNATYPGDPRIDVTFLTRWRNHANYAKVPQVADVPTVNDSSYTYPYWTYATDEYMEEAYAYKRAVARLPYELFADPSNPDTTTIAAWERADSTTMRNIKVTKEEKRGKIIITRDTSYVSHAKYFSALGEGNKWPFYGKLYTENAKGQRSSLNISIYRYAEMLLNYADVENELGNSAHAVDLVNEVLQRARQSAAGATQPAAWPKTLTQAELRDKIFRERIIETLGELNSYDNIRMRGLKGLEEILAMNNRHNFIKTADAIYVNDPGASGSNFMDYLYNGGDLSQDFVRKNLRLPIPTSEIDYNGELTNADNNFGY